VAAPAPPHRAKRALGTPVRLRSGLRQYGVCLILRLPSPYPSSRFARLGNGLGYYLPRLWRSAPASNSRLPPHITNIGFCGDPGLPGTPALDSGRGRRFVSFRLYFRGSRAIKKTKPTTESSRTKIPDEHENGCYVAPPCGSAPAYGSAELV